MHIVDVKFVANELTPGLANGEYKIEDGLSVRELIALCESRCASSVPLKNFEFMYPLFNGRPITLDGIITGNGILHICRVVTGG